jgi:hypothetical protein
LAEQRRVDVAPGVGVGISAVAIAVPHGGAREFNLSRSALQTIPVATHTLEHGTWLPSRNNPRTGEVNTVFTTEEILNQFSNNYHCQ